MFDLKIINSVIDQLEEERGIPREKTIEAIESSLATAYKKNMGNAGRLCALSLILLQEKQSFIK